MSTSRSGKEQGNYWIGWLQLRERVKKIHNSEKDLAIARERLCCHWPQTGPTHYLVSHYPHGLPRRRLPALCLRASTATAATTCLSRRPLLPLKAKTTPLNYSAAAAAAIALAFPMCHTHTAPTCRWLWCSYGYYSSLV